MGEEERIGEVLQAGGVVGHDVDLSWEVEGDMVVSMEALVLASPVAEVGCGAVTGYRALSNPGDGGRVVRAICDGRIPDVVRVGHEGHLAEQAGVFEVTVGDSAPGVVG